MALLLIDGPPAPVITLDEMKDYLRVVDDDEDDLIEGFISAVTQHLEGRDGWLGRSFVTQTWELSLDCFPRREIRIPLPPLQSVDSVKYDDVNGVEQTLSPSLYTVDTRSVPGWVLPNLGAPW